MRLKIFSCHHRPPDFTCNTDIFQTFVSNIPEPADGSIHVRSWRHQYRGRQSLFRICGINSMCGRT